MTIITSDDSKGLSAVTIASTLLKSNAGPAVLAEQVRAGLVSVTGAELTLLNNASDPQNWPIDSKTIQEGHIIFVRDEADDEGVMGTYYTYRGGSITRNASGDISGGSWVKLALGDQLTAAAVSALSGINFGVDSNGNILNFIRPQFQGSNLITAAEVETIREALQTEVDAQQDQIGQYQAGVTYAAGDVVYFGLSVGGSTKNTLYIRDTSAASAGVAPNANANNPWIAISDAEIAGFTIPTDPQAPTVATDVASMGYVDTSTPNGTVQNTENTDGTASSTKIEWSDLATKQFVEDESVTIYPTTDAEFNAFGNFRLSTGTIWISGAELWQYVGSNVEIVIGNYAANAPVAPADPDNPLPTEHWRELGIGGGGSSNTFSQLQDTPSAYPSADGASAERHNYVTVNSGNNGLDFVDPFPLSGAQNNQVATINGLVIRNIVAGDPTTGGGHIVFAIFEPRFASSAAPSASLRWDQPMTSATVVATNNDDVPGQYVNTVNSLTFNNVSFIDAPVVDASVTSGSTDLSYTVTSNEFYAKDAFTGSGNTSSNSTGNLVSWEVEDNNGNTYDSSSTQYTGASSLNSNVTWNAATLGNTVNTGGGLPFDETRSSFTVNHQVPEPSIC